MGYNKLESVQDMKKWSAFTTPFPSPSVTPSITPSVTPSITPSPSSGYTPPFSYNPSSYVWTNSVPVLSNGDLTATRSSSSGWGSARGSVSRSSSTMYTEVLISGTTLLYGIADPSDYSSTSYVGSYSTSISYWAINGRIYRNGGTHIATISSASSGDILGVHHNFSTNTTTFYKNGTSIAGYSFTISSAVPVISLQSGASATIQI